MAEALPQSFERELECSICHEPYEDPRFLPCFHTFCLECVQMLASKTGRNNVVTCPLCRKDISLPREGAKKLPKNNLAQIAVGTLERKKGDNPAMCQSNGEEHDPPQKAKFYCKTCKKAVCADCVVMHHRDSNRHPTISIDVALVKMKKEISALIKDGGVKQGQVLQRITSLGLQTEELGAKLSSLKSKIQDAFAEKRERLALLEKCIVQDVDDVKHAVDNVLHSRQSRSETEASALSDLNNFAEEIIRKGDGAIAQMHQDITYGYSVQEQGPDWSAHVEAMDRLSEMVSEVHFQRESKEKLQAGGRVIVSSDWSSKCANLTAEGRCMPTSLVACDNLVAVGYPESRKIEMFDREAHRCRTVGPVAVKDMTFLPSSSILILNQDCDVIRLSTVQKKCLPILVRDVKELEGKPLSVTSDAEGKYMLLYNDRIDKYSADGNHEQRIMLPERLLADLPLHIQFRLVRMNSNGQCLIILIDNGKAVRLLKIVQNTINKSQKLSASDVSQPDCFDDSRKFVTIDNTGNLFVAFVHAVGDYQSVTIKKYWGLDLSNEESVITDMELNLGEDERILMTALDSSCLVICTPKILAIFSKFTKSQFLHAIKSI